MARGVLLFLVLVLLLATAQTGCAPGAAPETVPTAAVEGPTAAPTPVPPTATTPPPAEEPEPTSTPILRLQLSSSAFDPGGEIPVRYTCHGANLSPPLAWSGMPGGTQSLVLLVHDPDSQPPGFVHWVIYNIPPSTTSLPEGVAAEATLPDGTLQGVNDFALFAEEGDTFPGRAPINRVGYDGPCPPAAHRYVFTLYALGATLDVPAESTMSDILGALDGHILAQAELSGVFTPP